MPRRTALWTAAIVAALLVALGLKLHIALTTVGTNDVPTWQRFTHEVTTLGGLATYRVDRDMNHPPFMVLALRGIHAAEQHTALPFRFWIRLPAIIADVVTLLLVAWRYPPTSDQRGLALLLLALAPPLILISGFHGNTDPVMITFVVLTAVLLDHRLPPAVAGIAFGMSLNIKIVPLLLAPALLLAIPTWRGRLAFGAAAALTTGIPTLPYLLVEPRLFLHQVIAYHGLFGQWGYTRLIKIFLSHQWAMTAQDLARSWGRHFLIGAIVGVSLWQARYRPQTSAFWRCGTVIATFFALTPGFGVQYLAWIVPWVVALGPGVTLAIYGTSGLFLFEVYNAWAKKWPWEYADSLGGWTAYPYIIRLELIAWLAICAALILFLA
ncbi:MAG TPA: glycosyltransferase 87 family protein, partial [Herpetosiphonaceae bacterium]|nr:glycosyltransferase 87 family protein [Herpetosiphonaceae bacterium]